MTSVIIGMFSDQINASPGKIETDTFCISQIVLRILKLIALSYKTSLSVRYKCQPFLLFLFIIIIGGKEINVYKKFEVISIMCIQ